MQAYDAWLMHNDFVKNKESSKYKDDYEEWKFKARMSFSLPKHDLRSD